ncbi:MAG TPA: hypothetical protein O0X23_02010 [Methanocorpusculum sp.]|nr:hypothetical protein [Methanocorpusculum sp.]
MDDPQIEIAILTNILSLCRTNTKNILTREKNVRKKNHRPGDLQKKLREKRLSRVILLPLIVTTISPNIFTGVRTAMSRSLQKLARARPRP